MNNWEKRLDEFTVEVSKRVVPDPDVVLKDLKSFIQQEINKAVRNSKSVRGYQMGHEHGTREECTRILKLIDEMNAEYSFVRLVELKSKINE